ncbi:unnamed protein product [Closterium sp. Yama58-4]|nr:unnamed protein product [Closterium sp. Yama58-4]
MGGSEGLRGDVEWRNRALAVAHDTNEPQLRQQCGPRCSVVRCGVVKCGVSSPAQRPYVAVLIVPTGVGAEIGGFAGDALPVARAFSSVAECLIAHPNVLNGAMLYWPLPRALYVEGHALDRFARGEWGLQPAHSNRVGLVFDRAIEDDLLLRHLQVPAAPAPPCPAAPCTAPPCPAPPYLHVPLSPCSTCSPSHLPPAPPAPRPTFPSPLQVADAARATLGIDIVGYTITDRPLKQVHKWVDGATGAATGRIDEADSLLRAVQTLLDTPIAAHPPSHVHALSPAAAPTAGARGVDAVGVVARFPDDAEEALQQYREGSGVDVLAGVEAVISHLVVHRFQLPAAHAPPSPPCPSSPPSPPALPLKRWALSDIGHTFLPCVLAGLSRAPRLVSRHAPPATAAERTGAGGGQEGQEAIASSIPTIIGGAWDYSRDARSSSSGSGTGMSIQSMGGGSGVVWAEDVDCVVLPADAFGGPAAHALAHRPGGPVSAALHAAMLPCCHCSGFTATCFTSQHPLFIAVEENSTVMDDPPSKLGIPAVVVGNYWEALGVMAAHKAGVSPWSLRRHAISHIPRIHPARS